ncbi:Uncharacterised protein [Legionella beliardensis]|uniref:Uncharacterized protein n=1 Tax=Legionella beliardensis TaxID=91822 RepID=A0A378I0Y6_9GAMM|nr:DUF6796 family protein [Legionella beliardensis]STX28380.1 Uncharacterised protein [Legionella beliardensis]
MDAIIFTGFIGFIVAICVGIGEFLLHFNAKDDRSQEPYQFMRTIPRRRLTAGHFISVLIAPLYLIGFWHFYKMLEPGGGFLPLAVAGLAGYSLIMDMAWLSSRAMLGAIMQGQKKLTNLTDVIRAYRLYGETLLEIVRFVMQVMSVGFIYLVWQGATYYPTWMIVFNPILILAALSILYAVFPKVGKYLMPGALHINYAIFFALSTYFAIRLKVG